MFDGESLGIVSLLPITLTLLIAFRYKSAAFALLIGCLAGVALIGFDPARGLNILVQDALGNPDFIWLCVVVFFIGIFFKLLKTSGVIALFTKKGSGLVKSRKGTKLGAWLMSFMIIDDYFSPLMTGVVMRPLSDKQKISREKLAYILDSTTASVCILVPFTAWAAYAASLILAQGDPVLSTKDGMMVFIHSIPYNFYPILIILFTLFISLELIPDFGPMRKAEKRASETGMVIRENAAPLTDFEIEDPREVQKEPNLIVNLLFPVLIIIGIITYSIIFRDEAFIAEAFITSVFYLSLLFLFRQKKNRIPALVNIIYEGMKAVLPTIIIIALAYCLNSITNGLGASEYIISVTGPEMSPALLVIMAFLFSSLISFATGSSWGTYAMMFPFVLSLVYTYTDGAITPLVYKTVAAVAGGGIFGDHASPVSDTSILSSAGAGSDHMDHVITQLPYAILIAIITIVLYLII